MKHYLLLLGILLGSTASLSALPEPLTAVPNAARPHSRTRKRVVEAPKAPPQIYYITNDTITGSHIPVVYRRFNGHTEPIASGFRRDDIFGAGAIGLTGATDVAGALRKLEPSIN